MMFNLLGGGIFSTSSIRLPLHISMSKKAMKEDNCPYLMILIRLGWAPVNPSIICSSFSTSSEEVRVSRMIFRAKKDFSLLS